MRSLNRKKDLNRHDVRNTTLMLNVGDDSLNTLLNLLRSLMDVEPKKGNTKVSVCFTESPVFTTLRLAPRILFRYFFIQELTKVDG